MGVNGCACKFHCPIRDVELTQWMRRWATHIQVQNPPIAPIIMVRHVE